MVRWQDAKTGRTHGRPGLHHAATGFALAPPNEDGWVAVHIPRDILLELVHTPTYCTWQGECWLFCCAQAMVYVGEWTRNDAERLDPNNPRQAFLDVFDDSEPWMWDYVPHYENETGAWGFYTFSCRSCGKLRGHFDMD